MLRGAPVSDDVDSSSVDEIIAVLGRFLLERVHQDLKIGLRDLPDEFSGRIVVQIDHQSLLVSRIQSGCQKHDSHRGVHDLRSSCR